MPKPPTDEDSAKRRIAAADFSVKDGNGKIDFTFHASWRTNFKWRLWIKRLAWFALPSGGLIAILKHLGIL